MRSVLESLRLRGLLPKGKATEQPPAQAASMEAFLEEIPEAARVQIHAKYIVTNAVVIKEGTEVPGDAFGIHYTAKGDGKSVGLKEFYAHVPSEKRNDRLATAFAEQQVILCAHLRLLGIEQRFPAAKTVIENDNGRMSDQERSMLADNARDCGLRPVSPIRLKV